MSPEVFPVATGPHTRAQFAQRFALGEHEGVDIFAPAGAELVAVADGTVRQATEPRGGHAVYLTERDGTQYYYSHLDAFAHPMMPGATRKVEAGDVLGYVGTSGNARGTQPHVHFEWRPKGAGKRDPFALLTRLAKQEEQALAVSPKRSKTRPKRRRPGRKAPETRRAAAAPNGGWAQGLGLFLILYAVARRV